MPEISSKWRQGGCVLRLLDGVDVFDRCAYRSKDVSRNMCVKGRFGVGVRCRRSRLRRIILLVWQLR